MLFQKTNLFIAKVPKNLEIKLTSFIFKSSKKGNTIIIHNSTNNSKIKNLKKKNIILIKFKLNGTKYFNLKTILKKLYSLNIRNLLIEGGDNITKNLIKSKLIDIFYLFQSPKILSKAKVHQCFTSLKILNKNYKKKYRIASKLAKDNITIYKRTNV